MADQRKILWVDDEIDLLRPHIKLLQARGYEVDTVTNGEDAVALVEQKPFDLIFLDESMVGMGGLETLAEIKERNSNVPVVMVTKNEAESVMEEAIGRRIADYLTKPVNPTQILLVCKKFLDGKKIKADYVQQDYIREFNQLAMKMMGVSDWEDWAELYGRLVEWELEFDQHRDIGLEQTLVDQKRDANAEFGKFVEDNYRSWLEMDKNDPERPVLSPDVVDRYVLPQLQAEDGPVFLFVVDCMRLDQWLVMEELLADYYAIERNYYFSILPTATTYARNSIFAGLFPSEIEKHYPSLWQGDGKDDDHSQNKHEKELLDKLLERKRIKLRSGVRYVKIIDTDFGRKIESEILDYAQSQLSAVVVNAVDMMAHSRSDYPILKEIAPDESAYRSLTKSWFEHSSLFGMLRILSEVKNAKIIVTTDHGAIRCLRGSKALGDRETSTNLRYKYGRNVKVDEKHALSVKDPSEFRLPRRGMAVEYVIAKEDYYFVYPTDYHYYLNHYRDSFQHGGISMEEMILPVALLRAR